MCQETILAFYQDFMLLLVKSWDNWTSTFQTCLLFIATLWILMEYADSLMSWERDAVVLFDRGLQVDEGTGASCCLTWNCNLFRQWLADAGEGSPEAPEGLTLCMQMFVEEI